MVRLSYLTQVCQADRESPPAPGMLPESIQNMVNPLERAVSSLVDQAIALTITSREQTSAAELCGAINRCTKGNVLEPEIERIVQIVESLENQDLTGYSKISKRALEPHLACSVYIPPRNSLESRRDRSFFMIATSRSVRRDPRLTGFAKKIKFAIDHQGKDWAIAVLKVRGREIDGVKTEISHMQRMEGASQVIQLKDHYYDPDQRKYYMIMERGNGGDLLGRITTQLLSKEAMDLIARDIGLGILQMTQRGLQHRDLKPANVVLNVDDQGVITGAKLIDLGLSGELDSKHWGIVPSFYSAPEITRSNGCYLESNRKNQMKNTIDVYAYGIILLEMYGLKSLSGRKNPDQLREIIHEIDDSICCPARKQLMIEMLAENPDERLGISECVNRISASQNH